LLSLVPKAPWQKEGEALRPEEARGGIEVKVGDRHPIAYRRGMLGTIVGRWGGEEYVAVDVRCADGHHRLFWPYDLEEIASRRLSWGRSKRGGGSA
jgi:hypothetical protein